MIQFVKGTTETTTKIETTPNKRGYLVRYVWFECIPQIMLVCCNIKIPLFIVSH